MNSPSLGGFPGRSPRTGANSDGQRTTKGNVVASIEYSQVRKGMVIVGDDGQLYHVVDRDLNTPGNWRAILQLKLKNLRSEEHTSELQSRVDLVCRLLLEKKKKNKYKQSQNKKRGN